MPLGANKAAIIGVAGVSTGDVVLIYDQDHTDASTVSITSGIDSTYGEYIFKFYNINPATAGGLFSFQANVAGQSGYNETITSSAFVTRHAEGDGTADLGVVGYDQAQENLFQNLSYDPANDADASLTGELHIFNPSSTTYVKHFWATTTGMIRNGAGMTAQYFTGGYFNVTGAIDEVQFKCSTGNFDGTIKMWGVK